MTTTDAIIAGDCLEGFRRPRQERSRRTLDRIADATAALLSEQGSANLTVQDVVARADTSVGAFYKRFDGKQVAVEYVRERSWDEARRLWRDFMAPEAWKAVPTPAFIAEIVRRFARILLASDRPTRALYLDLLVRKDERGLKYVRELDRDVVDLAGRLLGERAVGDPRSRSAVAKEGFRHVIAGLRDHLLFNPREDPRALILRLVRAYAALLGVACPGTYGEVLTLCAEARRLRGGAMDDDDMPREDWRGA